MWQKCKGFPNITWLSKLAFCQQDMPLAPDNNNSLSLKEGPIFLSITKDTLGLMAECSCQIIRKCFFSRRPKNSQCIIWRMMGGGLNRLHYPVVICQPKEYILYADVLRGWGVISKCFVSSWYVDAILNITFLAKPMTTPTKFYILLN